MIAKFIERLFGKAMDDAFPALAPLNFRFVWGPALSPLKTELIGLKRNHARGEVELEYMYADWQHGTTYCFSEAPRRLTPEIVKLNRLQARRAQRMLDITAKLERDSKVKGPKPINPGAD